jgi:hypothetical protein
MEIKKEVLTEKVIGYRCDVCGISCCKEILTQTSTCGEEEQHEWAILHAHWGYWSDSKDTEEHTCHMCEKCYDKVRYYIEVVLGGKVSLNNYI